MQLTESGFGAIPRDVPHLVAFTAPWCGHCKALTAELALAADLLGDKAVVAEVDATVETTLSADLDVQAYPTIYFLHAGEREEYDGARDAAALAAFVEDTLRDPVAIGAVAPVHGRPALTLSAESAAGGAPERSC